VRNQTARSRKLLQSDEKVYGVFSKTEPVTRKHNRKPEDERTGRENAQKRVRNFNKTILRSKVD